MTVKELIEKLKEHDAELPVVIESCSCRMAVKFSVYEDGTGHPEIFGSEKSGCLVIGV